jgi:hypothetical protein
MAYLADADRLLHRYPAPHAFVVGWNANAVPAPSRIVVANQDDIAPAVTAILSAWPLA